MCGLMLMLMMYYFKRFVLINGLSITFVLMLPLKIRCQDVEYEYTIEVPKYLCDKKQNLEAGVTAIRLSGKDAQKLKYDWTVNFKTVDTCKYQQRCTLMAWRAVRDLEKNLKKECTQENLQEIKINNAILVPGMQYILNVTVRSNDVEVGKRGFLLECTNSTAVASTISTTTTTTTTTITTTTTTTTAATDVANSVYEPVSQSEEPKQASLELLGTNVTYRDMVYILNAKVINSNSSNYYFKWEILDNSENVVIIESVRGSELELVSGLLTATEQYTIRCSLMKSEKVTAVAVALQNVQVLQRGMVLKLSVVILSVGLNQPFKLSAYFNDADNIDGIINIKWTCLNSNQENCKSFKSVNTTSIDSKGLSAIGRYNITITVTIADRIKEDWCEIQVVENGFAKIDVDDTDDLLDPSLEIDVPVYVSVLIASCTLQWMSVKAPDYMYLDLQTVPGNINALTNITLKEDEFLNEIDEFSNNTVDVEYNLKIPSPQGAWEGLEANASYLFRLNVTCPIAEDNSEEVENEGIEPLLVQHYVTLTADIKLHTDAPPTLKPLEITPTTGVALKTLFYFQTNESDNDYPVLYKFGYFLNNEIIFVSSLLDVTNTKSVLPYIDKGVKTVLEGCNSHSLCAQVSGPVVATEVPHITDNEYRNLMGQLTELMNREEYYKAFTYSLAILNTFNSIDKNLSTTMQSFMVNLTITEIKRLLTKSSDGKAQWRVPASNLLRNVGLLLDTFSETEELLNNVVSLRNKLSNKVDFKFLVENIDSQNIGRKLLMMDESKNRIKRQIDKITLDEVRRYLVISELIITTSPDKNKVKQEKQNMLNQIDKFLQQLCTNLYERSQTTNLELKTLILSVEKINRNNFNRYLHILYDTNSWKVNGRIKLGKCFAEKLVGNRMCMGKVVLKNYLNKEGLSYMIKVYNADRSSDSKFQTAGCDLLLVLPTDEKQVERKEVKCVFWKREWLQSQCKMLQVTAKTIQCSCNELGYYSLEYIDLPTTSTTIETTAGTPQRIIDDVETFTVTTLSSTTKVIRGTTTQVSTVLVPITGANTKTVNDPKMTVDTTEVEIFSITDELSTTNTSMVTIESLKEEDETILYFLIGFSLSGIGVLLYGIKYLLSKSEDTPAGDFPKYALLHHPEMLQDLPDH